ncbi:MAG: hypothetical protein WKG07_17680 [Hymenobacter sp.]
MRVLLLALALPLAGAAQTALPPLMPPTRPARYSRPTSFWATR